MKWGVLRSLSPNIVKTNGYEAVENNQAKHSGDLRIELQDCSTSNEETQKQSGKQGNFFKELERGLSVDDEVEEFLSCDVRRGRWRYKAQHSAVRDRTKSNNASRRCKDVLKFFLLKTYQEGLQYILACNAVWFICLLIVHRKPACLGIVILFSLVTAAMLTITYFKVYHVHQITITLVYACALCSASIAQFTVRSSYTEPTLYCSCCTVLVLLYTVLPLPEQLVLAVAITYTVIFEVCYFMVPSDREIDPHNLKTVTARLLLQMISHALGLYTTQLYQEHSECLIYNITKLAMAKEKLKRERKRKEKIIAYVMPESIRNKLIKLEQTQLEGVRLFRPMVMQYLRNVSILFADIVGFTKMSSNLRAIDIVNLLNIICHHFDRLTEDAGCTKISTLGDCYYCVSGCPEKMANHAPVIVDLGLKYLKAIEEINSESEHNLSIRVGIHTGSVLCGVVGRKRFRFDVWSNDVLLANQMESSGLPGKVHISETTYSLCQNKFIVVDAQASTRSNALEGMRTYFVLGTEETLHIRDKPLSQPLSQPPLRKSRSRGLFKLRFHSSSEGQNSSFKSLEEHISKLKSFSITSYDLKSPSEVVSAENERETQATSCASQNFYKTRASFSEAICTDRRVTETEVMSQIIGDNQAFSLTSTKLNPLTLTFKDEKKEGAYRASTVLKLGDISSGLTGARKAAGPTFLMDALMSLFFTVSLSAILLLSMSPTKYWVVVFTLSMVSEIGIVVYILIYITAMYRKPSDLLGSIYQRFSAQQVLPWIPRNVVAVILIVIPFVIITARVPFNNSLPCTDSDILLFLVIASFLHGINFLQVIGLLKILFLFVTLAFVFLYSLTSKSHCYSSIPTVDINTTSRTCRNGTSPKITECHYRIWDIPISLFLLFVLICLVIRTFERRIRLNFSSSIDAEKDQELHQKLTDQAYSLLENLIPHHILQELKNTGGYHRDHDNVGVLFACITNFQNFFDEQWRHGNGSIRILNELISDIDELLDEPKYKGNIEKIKTALGCTYMAASNLEKDDPHHMIVLVDFLFDIKKTLALFNKNTMGFVFEIKFGCHFGPIASGVIGSTAPMYDIWGDTVNLASRMMSTGLNGKIQVMKETADLLEKDFNCEKRGTVFIKGKGNIETYFIIDKIIEDTEI